MKLKERWWMQRSSWDLIDMSQRDLLEIKPVKSRILIPYSSYRIIHRFLGLHLLVLGKPYCSTTLLRWKQPLVCNKLHCLSSECQALSAFKLLNGPIWHIRILIKLPCIYTNVYNFFSKLSEDPFVPIMNKQYSQWVTHWIIKVDLSVTVNSFSCNRKLNLNVHHLNLERKRRKQCRQSHYSPFPLMVGKRKEG